MTNKFLCHLAPEQRSRSAPWGSAVTRSRKLPVPPRHQVASTRLAFSVMSEHYFTAEPAAPDARRPLHLTLAGRPMTLTTAPGVFSSDRLDLGTSVLLREAPRPPDHGDFLDLGCGWGPIALTLALESPDATVWALDVNTRALDLLRLNAETTGVSNVRPVEAAEVPGDVWFDLIWSNPPIRVGKDVLHELLTTWLPRLKPGGSAYLVVQRNLGSDSLQTWLTRTLGPSYEVTRHASAKGFRVLRVDALDDTQPPA